MRFVAALICLFTAFPALALTTTQRAAVLFSNAPRSPGFLPNCSSIFSTTNQLEQSQAMGTSPWTTGGLVVAAPTVTNNATTAPDGTSTATQITFPAVTGTNAASYVNQQTSGTGTLGITVTSVWAKGASGGEKLWLLQRDNGSGAYHAVGLTLTTSWQRMVIPVWHQTSALQNTEIGVDLRYSGATSTSAQTVYVWGAMLTDDNRVWPYIPTTTAAVTQQIPVDCPQGVKFRDWSYLVAWSGNPLIAQNTGAWNAGGVSGPYFTPWNPIISGSIRALANCTEASPNRTWSWQCAYTSPPGNPLSWTDIGSSNPVISNNAAWNAVFLLHSSLAPAGSCSLNTYCVYYNGKTTGGANSIGIASSPDMEAWTQYASNPILTGNGQNIPWIREVSGVLRLYAGLNNGNNGNILQYTSAIGDGVSFAYDSVANFTPLSGIDWEFTHYNGNVDTMVHHNKHGFYELTDSINFTTGPQQMGYAVSADGVQFWKYQAGPMCGVPSRCYTGSVSIGDGVLFEQAGTYYLLFNFDNSGSLSAGQAAMMPDY